MTPDIMITWLKENNPTPPKKIHRLANSLNHSRIFFHSADKALALQFLIKFHTDITKTNLDIWLGNLSEPLVLWIRLGELQNEEKIH